LKEYAAANDMILGEVYQDLGISGRKAEKRPAFQEMIALAKSKEHPYDAILVWKFSRFARNQEESIVYKSLLKKNDVDVISVSEPLPDGFIGELVERIFEWMDEYYSIRLSGEVRRGMAQKALSGGYNNRPPIGYRKDKGADTIPYPDEYYAPMVQRCFHMYAMEQVSFSNIAAAINDLGYRTRRGNVWETRNISDMIRNPFYIGKIRWNSNTTRRMTPHIGDEIVVDGSHEPIISQELWDKAQERYNGASKPYMHKSRKSIYKHWLSGVLRCPNCGGTLAYQGGVDKRRNKAYPYFLCWSACKGMCATKNSISAPKAEQYVLDGLLQVLEDGQIPYVEPIPAFKTDDTFIEKQAEAIRRKLSRLREAYMDGVETLEDYKAAKGKLEAELRQVESKIELPAEAPEPVTSQRIRSVYEFLLSSDDNALKSEAIHSIIDHIVYDKETDSMEFFFKV
jgi:DNA invertase Pin-like site-specific DNA recombinase